MRRLSPILGPDGQPIEIAVLDKEIAAPSLTGVRATRSDAIVSGLRPERLAMILRRAQEGEARDYLTLAIEIEERYLHYAAQLQTRRLAIEAIDPSLEATAGLPTAIIDYVERLVAEPSFRDLTGDLLDGIGKGYAVSEILWSYREGRLWPHFVWRDQRFFHYDRIGLHELKLALDGNPDGAPLPPAKFVVHAPRIRTGVAIRRGLARAAAWAYMIQGFALKDWAAFAEIYGVPLRVGKYHASATEEDKRALLRAVLAIANDAGIVIPEGMTIEFQEVTGQRGDAVFGKLIDYVDGQISKLVVGQTMTADAGSSGSLAQAKIHNEVRGDILKADVRQLATTIARDVIHMAVAINFGPQPAYPRVEWPVAEPEDVTALAGALEKLIPVGLKVRAAEVREKLGLSEPQPDDEVLTPAAAPRPASSPTEPHESKRPTQLALHGRGCTCAACQTPAQLAATPAGDPTTGVDSEAEALLEALLQENLDEWVEITDPIFAQYRDLLARATSFQDVLDALPALARADGSEALADKLARVTAIARGIGASAVD